MTGTNAGGQASATSDSMLVPLAPANSVAPVVSGTPIVADALTCSAGTWTGDPAPTLSYQWLRDDSAISGATDDTYIVQTVDLGHVLSCQVTASNVAGQAGSTSNGVQVVTPPANTSPPFVSGTPMVGATVWCSTGSWTGTAPTFAYRWLLDGAPIAGATADRYPVRAADLGHVLSCQVTASNIAGQQSATSSTVQVLAAPSLSLRTSSLKVKVGSRVTLSGTVANCLAGDTAVCIWRKMAGKLTLLKRVTAGSAGTFRWTMKPRRTGRWVFVASYKACSLTFKSKAVTVRVGG